MRTLVPFYADDLDALRDWIRFLDRRFPERRHALVSAAMGQVLPRIRICWRDDDDGGPGPARALTVTLAKIRDGGRRRCFGLLPRYEYGAMFETTDGVWLYTADGNLETLWRTLWSRRAPARVDGLPLQAALRLDAPPVADDHPAAMPAA